MIRASLVSALLAMIAALGCAEPKPQKVPPLPKAGLRVPAAQNVPIKPELRGQAKLELTVPIRFSLQ